MLRDGELISGLLPRNNHVNDELPENTTMCIQANNRKINQTVSAIGAAALPDGVVLYCLNEHSVRSHLAVQV